MQTDGDHLLLTWTKHMFHEIKSIYCWWTTNHILQRHQNKWVSFTHISFLFFCPLSEYYVWWVLESSTETGTGVNWCLFVCFVLVNIYIFGDWIPLVHRKRLQPIQKSFFFVSELFFFFALLLSFWGKIYGKMCSDMKGPHEQIGWCSVSWWILNMYVL